MTKKQQSEKQEPPKDWLQVMEDIIAREKLREQSEKEKRSSSDDEDDRQRNK
ncbi:MAG: hypothetical protein KME13_11395 [Myxacorys californica WJT36-NPBG1]|jgi:(p)ppGpp synthase/HD superfamily hydrolase|nr:hypothetical protein [Myxacorys californica WJT36-NPBG1]